MITYERWRRRNDVWGTWSTILMISMLALMGAVWAVERELKPNAVWVVVVVVIGALLAISALVCVVMRASVSLVSVGCPDCQSLLKKSRPRPGDDLLFSCPACGFAERFADYYYKD